MRIAFGDFVVDLDRRLLLRGGNAIHLEPKAFDLLTCLLRERPKVVTKDVLMQHLWPGTFVGENNLATLVSDLRSALGDSPGHPEFIRTSHGRGYAFAGNAIEQPDTEAGPARGASSWRLIWQSLEIPLIEGANLIGRPADGVIGIDEPWISRHHARISVRGARATVEDLNSKNGTWVDEVRVTAPMQLHDRSELRLGSAIIIVRHRSLDSTETVDVDRHH